MLTFSNSEFYSKCINSTEDSVREMYVLKKITSIVSALWYKHQIMYMSDRRLIRVTHICLRTGYIFCQQIRVTRISPR